MDDGLYQVVSVVMPKKAAPEYSITTGEDWMYQEKERETQSGTELLNKVTWIVSSKSVYSRHQSRGTHRRSLKMTYTRRSISLNLTGPSNSRPGFTIS